MDWNILPVAFTFQATLLNGSNHLQVRQKGATDNDGNLIFTEEKVVIK